MLAVPRRRSEGRYESEALSHAEVTAFLSTFHDLFTTDARASVWVGSTDGSGFLVLDEHDLIYAYGPVDEFARRLVARGYSDGIAAAPVPHEHRFNAEFDDLEDRVVDWHRWRRVLPVQDQDAR